MPADSADYREEALAITVSSGSLHYPFGEGECKSCHNEQSLGSMLASQPGLCYLCHQDLGDQYNYLHGPVAGGYCTACHDPHRSTKEKLLRFTGDELCLYCHRAESVLKSETHEGLEGMLCTDCHNPHGGEDNYIFQ
jgi:predicted CXXCH cytochrome family protein